MGQAINETGSPVVWGEPILQPDGTYRTVVVDPGCPFPTQPKPSRPSLDKPAAPAASDPAVEPGSEGD